MTSHATREAGNPPASWVVGVLESSVWGTTKRPRGGCLKVNRHPRSSSKMIGCNDDVLMSSIWTQGNWGSVGPVGIEVPWFGRTLIAGNAGASWRGRCGSQGGTPHVNGLLERPTQCPHGWNPHGQSSHSCSTNTHRLVNIYSNVMQCVYNMWLY